MAYYCVRQQDASDCGAACLATVAKQYGLKVKIAKIREASGTDRYGTNIYGMINAAKYFGFNAKGVRGNQESIFEKFPLPCIAHVVVNGQSLHYIVIHKITKNKLVIADPAKGIVKLSPEEFWGICEPGKIPEYKWTGIIIIMTPALGFHKEDQSENIFIRFYKLISPQKKLLTNIFFASLIYTILGILGAFYFQVLLDDVLPNGLIKTLHVLSLGVILLNVFKVLLNAFRTHLILYLSQKLDIIISLGYYQHVMELPMKFFETRKIGDIISRFQDATKVREAISGATLTMFIDILLVFAGGIILYMQSSTLFLVTIVMAFLYFVIVFAFHKGYEKLNEKQMENSAQLTSCLIESMNGIQTIKCYNAEEKIKRKTEIKFIQLLKSIFTLGWVSNLQGSLKSAVELIGGVVILWVGGINVIKGNLTIGQFITFNSLLIYFLDPIRNLINLQPQIQTALVAANRLIEIWDLEVEKTELERKKIKPKYMKQIEFKNVSFRYGSRELVLKEINFCIKAGQKVAFVGESGSGKTTIAKLLLHLYAVESGDVLIDGNHIEDIEIETLRNKIAYMQQDTFLFNGSIRDNISLGVEQVSLEDIIRVAKIVGIHSFINCLPGRYETLIDENGANLSGGQKQRLSIARALLKKPDVLVLDEATSNLDAIAERNLEHSLNKFCANMTVVFIAHRLSTIKNCDRIFVVDNGVIVEAGTHGELIRQNGKYALLVKRQSLGGKTRDEINNNEHGRNNRC